VDVAVARFKFFGSSSRQLPGQASHRLLSSVLFQITICFAEDTSASEMPKEELATKGTIKSFVLFVPFCG
jgi:hypothetical protein